MKVKLGAKNCLYPLPTTIVGANVGGKPNYIAIAHVGIMALKHVSLSMNKRHYTNAGIIENGTFSINLPSVEMVEEID
jgi:flavin reductase (DIM6/NTAB) family NADH-FMN oxidoreductase RutF